MLFKITMDNYNSEGALIGNIYYTIDALDIADALKHVAKECHHANPRVINVEQRLDCNNTKMKE